MTLSNGQHFTLFEKNKPGTKAKAGGETGECFCSGPKRHFAVKKRQWKKDGGKKRWQISSKHHDFLREKKNGGQVRLRIL